MSTLAEEGNMPVLHKVFGRRKPEIDYGKRTCAYLITFDENHRIPAAKTAKGYFLLGGGVESGESRCECISRECLEEIGYSISVEDIFCYTERYHYSMRFNKNMYVQAYFYNGNLLKKVSEPTEADHTLVWLSSGELANITIASQRWAVESAYNKLINKPTAKKRHR